jgi:hypothetical protein
MEIRVSHYSVEWSTIYAATIFPKVAVWLFVGMSLSLMHFGMLPWMRKGNDATSCLPLDGCFVFRILYETGWSTSEEGLAMYFWSSSFQFPAWLFVTYDKRHFRSVGFHKNDLLIVCRPWLRQPPLAVALQLALVSTAQ